MQFPFVIPFFAVFASLALASHHASCTAHNGDSYNWRITQPACVKLATVDKADVQYQEDTGRCTSKRGNLIEGNKWTHAIKTTAKEGFPCADGKGTCFADEDDLRGKCD